MGKGIRRRDLLVHGSSFLTAAAISGPVLSKSANAQVASISADEAQRIAEEAYVFAFPLNYYYRTIYSQIIDPDNKNSLGGFGKWRHDGLARPEDKETTMPNNDTPYSWAWVDVRSEPWVLVSRQRTGTGSTAASGATYLVTSSAILAPSTRARGAALTCWHRRRGRETRRKALIVSSMARRLS